MKINAPILTHKLIVYSLFILYFASFFLLPPIYGAIILAYLVYPLVQFVHQVAKIPHIISVFLISILLFATLLGFGLVIFQSLTFIYPILKESTSSLIDLQALPTFLPVILKQSLGMIEQLVSYLSSSLQKAFDSLLQLFIFIVAFYFSLHESKKNRLWFFSYVPKICRELWMKYFTKAMQLFSYFLFVEFQLFSLAFFLLAIGFTLLDFEAAISKAFLIALADCLPFFGIGLFLLPLAGYFAFTQQFLLAITILVLYVFIQITRQLVESKLWATTFHLRSVHTFFIGAGSILLFGFYGILLSPFFLLIAVKLKERAIFDK